MRVGIIDSGVHAAHPHVGGVAGGVGITSDGREEGDYVDRIGHGTAVAAVIREKAPEAEIYAVKVFYDALATRVESLIQAIDWCVARRMDFINLSLGTQNATHEGVLRAAVERVNAAGIRLVAAGEDQGIRWLPGCLAGVIAVRLDWDCPRDEHRLVDGVYYASGYPRPIPRVPKERNLRGISFAVANVTGLLVGQALPPVRRKSSAGCGEERQAT